MKLELELKPWIPISEMGTGKVTILDGGVAVNIGDKTFVPRNGRGTVRFPEAKTLLGEKLPLPKNPFS